MYVKLILFNKNLNFEYFDDKYKLINKFLLQYIQKNKYLIEDYIYLIYFALKLFKKFLLKFSIKL